jgi:hypothetical protein
MIWALVPGQLQRGARTFRYADHLLARSMLNQLRRGIEMQQQVNQR